MLRITLRTLLTTAALTACSADAFAGGLTAGNLVIDRIGDGSAVLSGNAAPVFLDEYATTGALVQSLVLPTTANGTSLALTDSGTATSDGQINVSNNGQFVTLGGYNAASGTTGVVAQPPATVPRVVGIISVATGTVDTTTSLGGYYVTSAAGTTGNNLRDVASPDGVTLYTSGSTFTPQTGIAYTTQGATANPTGVSTAATNTRAVNISTNNLYYSTGSGGGVVLGVAKSGIGIYLVPGTTPGTLPTAAITPTQVAASPAGPGTTGVIAGQTGSPYDILFADANTMYVADDRSVALGGGLEKFTSTDGFTTLANTAYAYTLTVGTVGLRSVAFDGTNFFATTADATLNKIVTFTDPGTGTGSIAVTATTVATAATNEIFRGVRVVPGSTVVAPEPSSLLVTLVGMGALGLLLARRRMARTA